MLTEDQKFMRAIHDAWTTPIVFPSPGWADTAPEWLKTRAIAERIEMIQNGGWDKGTDAEVSLYLYCANLEGPLGQDWCDITLYEAALQMPQIREVIDGTPDKLSDYQLGELNHLKSQIRSSQLRNKKGGNKDMIGDNFNVWEQKDGLLIGVDRPGCDPSFITVPGSKLMDFLTPQGQALWAAQEEKWKANPRNKAYTPPAAPAAAKETTPKPATKTPAATVAGNKADELPLLKGKGKPKTAPQPTAEETDKNREALNKEAAALEKKPAQELNPTVGQLTPDPAHPENSPQRVGQTPAAPNPDTVVPTQPAAGETKGPETVTKPAETVTKGPENVNKAPENVTAAASTGEVAYWLKDGRGPFENVQAAMDAMGMAKATRPAHNRWDRLSTALKEQIIRKAK